MTKTVVRPVIATNASITYRCSVCGWEEEHLFWNDTVVFPSGGFRTHYCPDKAHPMWRGHEVLYEQKFGDHHTSRATKALRRKKAKP